MFVYTGLLKAWLVLLLNSKLPVTHKYSSTRQGTRKL